MRKDEKVFKYKLTETEKSEIVKVEWDRDSIIQLPLSRGDGVFDARTDAINSFNLDKLNEFYPNDFIPKFSKTIYFSEFLNLICNPLLRDAVKFANDVLLIPPIKSFIFHDKDMFNREFSATEKMGLSACFDYLYRYVYGEYKPKLAWIGDDITGIQTGRIYIKEGMNWR